MPNERKFDDSELMLNADGSIFHLKITRTDIADTIILVGDPDRVASVSAEFDEIRVKKKNREFLTHTGRYRGHELTVLSTGIGACNIDIVLNELDALVNIDPVSRQVNDHHHPLRFIRIGTCGVIAPDIQLGDLIRSDLACGWDNLLSFYRYEPHDLAQSKLAKAAADFLQDYEPESVRYFADPGTDRELSSLGTGGITLTMPSFYGAQNRFLRLSGSRSNLIGHLAGFDHPDGKFMNFEMETAAIFALARLLGHAAFSFSIALTQRNRGQKAHDSSKAVQQGIQRVLTARVPRS